MAITVAARRTRGGALAKCGKLADRLGAAQWEEYEEPEVVPRQCVGSEQRVSQGGGEFSGWRRRWDKWTERAYFEKKRAKVAREGRVIRRTGPREEKGTFLTWAKEYVETPVLFLLFLVHPMAQVCW